MTNFRFKSTVSALTALINDEFSIQKHHHNTEIPGFQALRQGNVQVAGFEMRQKSFRGYLGGFTIHIATSASAMF
ncbi:hypothetical protein PoB_004400500 [Plakobranchus ocellatus]|uniref:Uncharacterized protein n=1 Tax=Plakobranchus ocellatus TaxID=259542 RepID=A0AAV4BA71_9GAST|nr:hypothetical protein PoB_004400500 [Plakobranchus ocellatus]